ncbi:MAG TPA: GNAT family N-acetyltransferase [Candidatus Paceibacterota bacterium]|nr:GNAT family N-acetyltransferase [Candidatus Paceibacterota bacterium]
MIYLKHKETLGILPTSEYELFDDKICVGKIQIRHKPSHGVGIPESMASHIYYEILPEYRSKGYGKRILALGLEEAKRIGLKEVSITCMEDNIGSKKIIEANGAIFVEDAIIPKESKKMLKYRIMLSDPYTSN